MRIIKPFDGTLDIELANGTIWLNSCDGYCVLRIGGLKFSKVEEKFSMIDILNGKAVMYKDNEHTMITNFLQTVFGLVSSKIVEKNGEERQEFLIKLLENLKKNIQEEK